jgi:hypothetical protein
MISGFDTRIPQGMLLIEVVLYVAIATTVLASAATLYALITAAHSRESVRVQVTESSRIVLLDMVRAIENTQSISAPAMGTSGDENGAITMQEDAGEVIPISPVEITISDFHVQNVSAGSSGSSAHIEFAATYANPGGRSDHAYTHTYGVTASTRN